MSAVLIGAALRYRETGGDYQADLRDFRRSTRHIGDFRAWEDHDAYQRTLERLLRDLRVEAK
jgi:hypothetical protein